jgi:hypothetical protein
VLRALDAQLLLVAERRQPGDRGETAGEGAFADARRGGEVGQPQVFGEAGVDEVLGAVDGVVEVGTVPEHGTGLLLVAVAAGVDDHAAGDPRGGARPVADGEQVKGEVDAAGNAGRRDDAAVDDVQHVADDGGAGVAAGQRLLEVVVGGAAPAVQQARPAEGVRARADAGDGAPGGVVVVQAAQRGRVEPAGARQGRRAPAGDDDQVVGGEGGPAGAGAQRDALGAGNVLLLGDVVDPVVVAEVGRGGEHLGGPGEVQEVESGDEQEDDPGHNLPQPTAGRCPQSAPRRW